jgi:predicted enzyme related to lactoylglutathione lyase
MGTLGEVMEVILYAQDMQAQVEFYRDKLGLQVKAPKSVQDFRDVYWVELDTGACTLVLHGGGQRVLGKDAPKFVFRVTDVEAARTELVKRGVSLSEVRSPAPDVFVCDAVDPEGNKFSIEQR